MKSLALSSLFFLYILCVNVHIRRLLMPSRRQFLTGSAGTIAATLAASQVQATDAALEAFFTNLASLCGEWLFRTNSTDSGTSQHWYDAHVPSTGWRQVKVPHRWQIEAPLAEYYGVVWYC
jgi:hypothetical protein